ncbi:c-type cytochrome [uncultured Aquabacterium sp.]|uniref:c-type cytochrome n=1 Tax=uncultured Aquabacterium sp. TaxID=158753 RepID=UPI0030D25DC5|tara:strand:+ start:3567 stop:4265 length:699 start_codon:yes stop_codon:yes gene_type:complete
MKTPSMRFSSLAIIALAAGLTALGSTAAQAQTADGTADATAARQKVAMCIGCHGIAGYQASFPEVHKVPKISGQNAKYIAAALTAYRKGERKHPTMKGIAASMSDQDIADVAAFYEASGKDIPSPPAPTAPAAAPADIQALLTKGNCMACHGADLNKPIDASYPKIAGQHADYLYVALKSYQTERNPQIGRANAIMGTQAKLFTHTELKQLATYVASLPGELKTVAQPKLRR